MAHSKVNDSLWIVALCQGDVGKPGGLIDGRSSTHLINLHQEPCLEFWFLPQYKQKITLKKKTLFFYLICDLHLYCRIEWITRADRYRHAATAFTRAHCLFLTSSSCTSTVRAQLISPLLHSTVPEVCTSCPVRLTPLLTRVSAALLKVALQNTCKSSKALNKRKRSRLNDLVAVKY